jgi:hypothetical protein
MYIVPLSTDTKAVLHISRHFVREYIKKLSCRMLSTRCVTCDTEGTTNVTYPASSGHGMLSDGLVKDLTVSSCLHALHEDDLCGHERELEV